MDPDKMLKQMDVIARYLTTDLRKSVRIHVPFRHMVIFSSWMVHVGCEGVSYSSFQKNSKVKDATYPVDRLIFYPSPRVVKVVVLLWHQSWSPGKLLQQFLYEFLYVCVSCVETCISLCVRWKIVSKESVSWGLGTSI